MAQVFAQSGIIMCIEYYTTNVFIHHSRMFALFIFNPPTPLIERSIFAIFFNDTELISIYTFFWFCF